MLLNLAGRVIDVDDVGLAEMLREAWGPTAMSQGPDPTAHPVATVIVDDAVLPPAAGPSDLALRSHDMRVCRSSDDDFRIVDEQSGAAVRVRIGDPSVITIHGWTEGIPVVLDVALGEVLAVAGVARLHASTVTDGSRTLVLLGPSGRGKSTTMLRAVRAGWSPLAEDASFVDLATLRVHGCDTAIRLRPDAAHALVGIAVPEAVPTVDLRHEVPFEEIGGRASHAAVTHLVHLRRGIEAAPTWAPMSRRDAVMALFEASGAPVSARARATLAAAFPGVVARTRTLSLELGPLTSPFPALS